MWGHWKKNPKDAPVKKVGSGEYIHYGVADALTDFLIHEKEMQLNIYLNINIDGLPLSKSSNLQIWPILMNINTTDNVYVIGAYTGHSKPDDCNLYLKEFIDELSALIENGFLYNNNLYNIHCRSFVCDSPARSFILGVKGHTGYSSCIKWIFAKKNNI